MSLNALNRFSTVQALMFSVTIDYVPHHILKDKVGPKSPPKYYMWHYFSRQLFPALKKVQNELFKTFRLTRLVRFPTLDDGLSPLPGYEEPLRCVAQVLVLDGKVLGQDGTLRQSVGVRAEEEILFVLARVVTVSGGEDVLVQLDHGEDGRVKEVLRVADHVRGVFPHPGSQIIAAKYFNQNRQIFMNKLACTVGGCCLMGSQLMLSPG